MTLPPLEAYTFCRDLSLSDAQKVHEPSAQLQLQGLNLFTTLMFVLQHKIENVSLGHEYFGANYDSL